MKKWKDLMVTERFHQKDDILASITFEELITTVTTNEKVMDEKTVKRVWKELLKNALGDAEHELKQNMKAILKELQTQHTDLENE